MFACLLLLAACGRGGALRDAERPPSAAARASDCPAGTTWNGTICATQAGRACDPGMQFDPMRGCVWPEAPAIYAAPAPMAVEPEPQSPGPPAAGSAPTAAPGPPSAAFPEEKRIAPERKAPSGQVSNAAQVVAGMRAAFRDCYRQELAVDRDYEGKVRLKIHVGAEGKVTTVAGVAIPPRDSLVTCMKNAVFFLAKFNPPEGEIAVIGVPVTFVLKR